MSGSFVKSIVEEAPCAWMESSGWQVANKSEITPGMPAVGHLNCGESAHSRIQVEEQWHR